MSLESILKEVDAEFSKANNRCSMFLLMEGLNTKDRAALQSWLDDPTKSIPKIVTALQRAGHRDMTRAKVAKHRRGECACRGPQ